MPIINTMSLTCDDKITSLKYQLKWNHKEINASIISLYGIANKSVNHVKLSVT